MPGSIHVSVLEAFDLPETCTDGESVSLKVSLGTTEFQTSPCIATHGKTPPWNVDFEFPFLNLRDKLVVVLITDTGTLISKRELDTSSIVERGHFSTNLLLDSGGKISLGLSFQLTDEERKRIDMMRAAALKRRQDSLKRTDSKLDESKINDLTADVDSPLNQSINTENRKIHNGDGSVTDGSITGGEELSPSSVKAKIKAFESSAPQTKPTTSGKLERVSSGESPHKEKYVHMKQNKKEKAGQKNENSNFTEASGRRRRPKASSAPIRDSGNPTADVKREMQDGDSKKIESKGSSLFGISKQVLGGLMVVAAGVIIWAISSDKRMKTKRSKMRQLTRQRWT